MSNYSGYIYPRSWSHTGIWPHSTKISSSSLNPSETIVCPQHQRGGPAEAHWHTAGGSSPHRPSDSRPGKKFKNPRPKARPGAEGDQARRSSSLPRTLPAQGLAVGITALAVLASSPLLYLGTLHNTQHLGGPT